MKKSTKLKGWVQKTFCNDDVGQHQTIYDVDVRTLIHKNILAGFARSIGAWIFNLVILGILALILIPMLGDKWNEFMNKITGSSPDTTHSAVEIITKF